MNYQIFFNVVVLPCNEILYLKVTNFPFHRKIEDHYRLTNTRPSKLLLFMKCLPKDSSDRLPFRGRLQVEVILLLSQTLKDVYRQQCFQKSSTYEMTIKILLQIDHSKVLYRRHLKQKNSKYTGKNVNIEKII